jgi:vancomycin resistance protein YoaR
MLDKAKLIFVQNYHNLWRRLSITGIIVLIILNLFLLLLIPTEFNKKYEPVKVKNLSEDIFNQLNDINLKIENETKILSSKTIESWLEVYIREYTGKKDLRISPQKLNEYLSDLALLINTQPVNAKLLIINGKAEEFVSSEYGRKLDIETSQKIIIDAIFTKKTTVTLPVNIIEPNITLEKINKLGITTLIGQGKSDFKGSPSSRIHNIKIGLAKYNGIIIKPGEIFSFNDLLGEVNEKNGYQSELIIKNGKLVYEYGGGLCQISTTLFRAAIMAGLPILERKPHSFPVRYYNPQGFDATIYPGVVDLKFKNDTPGHLLIQSKIEGTKLIFEIYGTDDGRKTTIEGPYQYDQKANGSLKSYFKRKITFADNSLKEETFYSYYKPPVPLEKNPLE